MSTNVRSKDPLYTFFRFSKKRVIVPEEAGISVLKGAVILGHDPTASSERKRRYHSLILKRSVGDILIASVHFVISS